MVDLVRMLNDNGTEKFKGYLASFRAGSAENSARELLNDAWSSAKLPIDIEIENRSFQSRLEAARYISALLEPLGHAKTERNVGLWSWLSLYYLDQLSPVKANGRRRPGLDYRFVLNTVSTYYYRHLLFGSFIAYRIHGEKAALLLYNRVSKTNKFHLELFARQGFITNKGIIEAANLLYFDSRKRKPKRGAAATERQPGTLFRFIDVVHQLDLTYDLNSMSGEEILDLLPLEFNEWKNQG